MEVYPYKEISKVLALRESAIKLFDKIKKSKDKTVIINFKNVEFMSRSFADEYLNQKKFTKKSIKEKNTPREVQRMLRIVEKSKSNHKRIALIKVKASIL